MKKTIDNKWELEFKISIYGWYAIALLNEREIEIDFEDGFFESVETIEIDTKWKIIEDDVRSVFQSFEELIRKSENVLKALHKEIFGNEYYEKKGYFDLSYINILRYDRQFELVFLLESKTDYMLDPYFSYFVTFERNPFLSTPTIVGVRRG